MNSSALSAAEIALLSVLVSRGTQEWSAAARAIVLDDDALAEAVDTLLARGAIALVRAEEPQPVSLAATAAGVATFTELASLRWRAPAPASSASG